MSYDDGIDSQCNYCPWTRKRAARNDRFLTLGDPRDGVTVHLRLCNTHATKFDKDQGQWVAVGAIVSEAEVPAKPAAAPPVAVHDPDANKRLLALTQSAAERRAAAAKVRRLPSVADQWQVTRHAADRAQERRFTVDQMLRAAVDPEKVIPSPKSATAVYHARGDCCVVVNPAQKRIITVHDKFTMLAELDEANRKGA
jgi:hypothetical protein